MKISIKKNYQTYLNCFYNSNLENLKAQKIDLIDSPKINEEIQNTYRNTLKKNLDSQANESKKYYLEQISKNFLKKKRDGKNH